VCGIAGIFNYNSEINPEEVSAVLSSALFTRGPDDTGTFIDHTTLLVHRRLSILDLSAAGHQPMQDRNHEFVIVYNGEIYNFAEIKNELTDLGAVFKSHTDTEVVLNAYRHWGDECLHKFRGMFAFAIYDKLRKNLFLARDRFGIKPLIWSKTKDQFVFSSELAPLIKAGLVEQKININALHDYISTGSVLQPETIYKDVYQLEPGSSMLVKSDGTYTKKNWYDIINATYDLHREISGLTYTDLTERLKQELDTAAAYHAVSDVPVGAFLSGGVDSAAVSALLSKHIRGRLKTFSIGFEQQDEVTDELAGARDSAMFLESEHHPVVVTDKEILELYSCFANKLDQPSMDGFNTFIVSKHTAQSIKVAISGLGGDELFAGYPHFADIQRQSPKMRYPLSSLLAIVHNHKPNNKTRQALYRGLTPFAADIFFREYTPRALAAKILKPQISKPHDNGQPFLLNHLSPLAEISYSELNGYLLSTLLRDCDVCSMAHSLEVRPLLLDHKVAEFAFALPDSAKIKAGRQKAILSDAMSDLISQSIAKRRKSGFELPFGRWLSGVLNERFNDLLSQQTAKDLFTAKHINNIRAAISTPIKARRHWRELVLLSWFYRTKSTL